MSTGVTVSARPNKIVAGLDVAKTNELLQTIAKALEKNVSNKLKELEFEGRLNIIKFN